MTRLAEVMKFLEYDNAARHYVEPDERLEDVRMRLGDVLHSYNPGVVVKAGLGSGALVRFLAAESDSYIAVVEPSISLIEKFISSDENAEAVKRIHFINGDFHDFPIDYYKADLVVCVDYLDFFDSSRCIDEFRRALQFDGVLFLCGTMLADEDTEGVYDEFVKSIFPLHNDYYLEEDLKTFLELKEFRFIKGARTAYKKNLFGEAGYFDNFSKKKSAAAARSHIDSNIRVMKEHYRMSDEYVIEEPYFMGYFMRNKPAASSS
jgi:ubiquinone/menaquinone biosynthesis C-methylase UbiE